MVGRSADHDDVGMDRVRLLLLITSVCLLAGCSGGTAPPGPAGPTSSAAPPTASGGIRVEAVIDLKGAEAYGLTVDASAVWAISYQASTLSRVDPATNAVTLSVPLANAASALATGDAIWVVGYGGGPAGSALYRVDPATGRTVATVAVGEACCDLSEGGGAVWDVDPGGAVVRVDPARNAVARRFAVTLNRNVHVNAVYGGGAVWVSSDDSSLQRLDARSGRRTTVDTGGGVPFLAQDGLIWGAAPNRLWAVDERTGRVARTVELADSMEVLSLAVGPDAIWVGLRRPGRVGTVVRLDPGSGQVRGELRDIDIPARIVLGFGSVWVTDSGSSSLYRLAAA
jgi:outer membrane protein assembly factor BamB